MYNPLRGWKITVVVVKTQSARTTRLATAAATLGSRVRLAQNM
jgi:hypothetical protein